MTVKISDLPAGTEFESGDILAIVQDNTTKKLDANATWTFGAISTGSATITGGNISGITEIEPRGTFAKTDRDSVAWTKTGAGTAETAQKLFVEVGGKVLEIDSGESIAMPSLSTGTDYAIWVAPDGTLEADASFTVAPTAGGRRVGGFHYAPGGNAPAQAGGDTVTQINEYSFWDLKFRPSCEDPRGMALVAGGFWADIYLLNTDPDSNGTSSYNKTIADGSSPPIVPDAFGGNGVTTYGSLTWFEAQEVLAAYGKKAPTYAEFMALAYGVTEETSRGSDPGTTGVDDDWTSRWGIMQATGNMWIWSRDFIADGTGTFGFQDIAEGRGEVGTFDASARASLLGGFWNSPSQAGSRCSVWGNVPSDSFNNVGARGVCDHLMLD